MCASCRDLFSLPKCVHLPHLKHLSLMTKIYGLLIAATDNCIPRQKYLGFSMVTLPPRFGCDNLKNILVRPFRFGMWVYMGNATNAIVL